MKLFGYEIKASKVKQEDMGKMPQIVPGWMDNNKNFLISQNTGSLLNAYKSWVYVCANKNATSFAQQKLKLYVTKQSKKDKVIVKTKPIDFGVRKYIYQSSVADLGCVKKAVDIEEVIEHPLLDLFKNVNQFMNKFELFEMIDLYQELTGNAYLYVVKNSIGVPSAMWVLSPDKMTIVPSKSNWIAGYIYRNSDGTEVPFTIDEIIHFKFPNPKDPYYGWSPLQAMADSYNLNLSYMNYEQKLINNTGIPPIALVAPKDVAYQESDFKRIISRWNKTYMGETNVGKTAWLEGGFDIKQLNISPKDMNNLLGRKWTREEIAGAYGVPISKLTTDDVNRANAEAGNYSYLNDTISPRCIRFQEKANERLVPMFDERMFLLFDDPVPENREFILKERESNLKNKVTSIDEEREKLGLDKIEWGKYPVGQQSEVPYDGTKPEPPATAPQMSEDSSGSLQDGGKGNNDRKQGSTWESEKVPPETKEFISNMLVEVIANELKKKEARI